VLATGRVSQSAANASYTASTMMTTTPTAGNTMGHPLEAARRESSDVETEDFPCVVAHDLEYREAQACQPPVRATRVQ
jgi:hypothetical protein